MTVLLLHSGGFTSRQWRKLGEALAPTHRVVAPDLTGYGARPRWPAGTPFHFQTDIELAAELMTEPMHIVGHSYGGLIGLQLALAHPDRVRSLSLYEPVAFGILDEPVPAFAPFELDQPDVWLAAFVDWWNGPGAWQKLPADTQAAFRDVGWKLSEEVRTLMADRTGARYAEILQPTLLLGGGKTPAPERRVLDALAVTLPHATLRIFPELGHMGPITAAAAVNAAIVEHVIACDR
ncbi:MAG TPA: alpha/beta fold hydrolase [Kofleriaceae bacterium]|jgi:pimeloyl-ACP methyl ester carboxylesterase|nr:alpha/beta fold hydrolase [Kofleriaceae bacterium]